MRDENLSGPAASANRDLASDDAGERESARIRRVYTTFIPRQRERWALDNPGNRLIAEERSARLAEILQEEGVLPLEDRRVLEVGCGLGDVLSSFRSLGAATDRLVGVDLVSERLEEARFRFPKISLLRADGAKLPFQDESFDLVVAFTVFSSILNQRVAEKVASEMRRVLRPGGVVVWYDLRYGNPANPHLRGVPRDDVRTLFPGYIPRLLTITLLPPLARRLGRMAALLYPVLNLLPPLRTHYLGVLRKIGS